MPNEASITLKEGIPWNLVRCPICQSEVIYEEGMVVCKEPKCQKRYPVIDGIPILINEESSIFSFKDFSTEKSTFFKKRSRLFEWLNRNGPSISHNIAAKQNYRKLTALALEEKSSARILVIGGSIAGQGFEILSGNRALELVETDVSFGPRVKIVCDGHDLPFVNGSFDVVIVQAVLEHVVDPFRCVSEIVRVLKVDGLVYAETPFMQQVHGGSYDFMRFTKRGHRRLFREFDEIQSGMTGGPGMALAWSLQYFFRAIGAKFGMKNVFIAFARFTSFYLKYFDYFLNSCNEANDAASGFYFIGKKSSNILKDGILVNLYSE